MHKMIENMQNMHIFLGFNTFRTYLTEFDNIYEFVYIQLLKLVYLHIFLCI